VVLGHRRREPQFVVNVDGNIHKGNEIEAGYTTMVTLLKQIAEGSRE